MLIQVNEVQYQQIFRDLINKNYKQDHYFGVITSPVAIHQSRTMDYDEDYCIEHNIPILKSDRAGGTIVTFKNDIAFFYIQESNSIPKEIIAIQQFLKSKGLNAYLDYGDSLIGRDILIDSKYKVATFTNTTYGNVVFTAGHISMSVDLDIIKHICNKPMRKIPKGLKDYGIVPQEIIEVIKQVNNE